MGKQRLSDASQRKGFSQTSRSANIAPIVFLSIISVILAIAVALVLREYFQSRELASATAIEKAECEERADEFLKKLNDLDAAYQGLMREHADLQLLANQQRSEISRLRAQIRSIAGTQRLDDVKERIDQLEQELALYQSQVEVLSEDNVQLSGEYAQVKSNLAVAEEQIVELEVKNQGLNEQIDRASVLKIINIEVITTRQVRRGERITTRAGRVDKIQICFNILDNILAQPGNRIFYTRITGPNGQLLTNGETRTFELLGNQVPFTVSKTFEYKNEQQVGCMVYSPANDLEKGIYRVAIFAEGRELGTQLFELN